WRGGRRPVQARALPLLIAPGCGKERAPCGARFFWTHAALRIAEFAVMPAARAVVQTRETAPERRGRIGLDSAAVRRLTTLLPRARADRAHADQGMPRLPRHAYAPGFLPRLCHRLRDHAGVHAAQRRCCDR